MRCQRSGCMRILISVQLAEEPGFCQFPVAQNGFDGNSEHLCGFVGAQSAEEAEFHNAAFAFVNASERIQSVIQGNHAGGAIALSKKLLVERKKGITASSLYRAAGT